jgi:hypothetical protein
MENFIHEQLALKDVSSEIGSECSDQNRCYHGNSWTHQVQISREITAVKPQCISECPSIIEIDQAVCRFIQGPAVWRPSLWPATEDTRQIRFPLEGKRTVQSGTITASVKSSDGLS